jgi:hypothetical protein
MNIKIACKSNPTQHSFILGEKIAQIKKHKFLSFVRLKLRGDIKLQSVQIE